MTLREHLRAARTRLTAAGIPDDEAARDAALLARHVLGWDRVTLLAGDTEEAPDGFAPAFDRLLARRAGREPIAYIRGVQEFHSRDFLVSSAVLIPRPETEFVVEEALTCLRTVGMPPEPRVVDVGTGSGCLAVTLAAEWPSVHVVGTDISLAALGVAEANAARHGVAARITWRHGRYLAGVLPPLDLIVANPPYVPEDDAGTLAPEVAAFEPEAALFGGRDGLRDLREIVRQASEALRPGGWLVMEIGAGQDGAVQRLIEATDTLACARLRDDLQGIPRVVVARRR